jgi:hypothetical protein
MHGRAHAAVAPANAPFHQGRDTEAPADLARVDRSALEQERRRAGDDEQVGGAGQFAGQLLGQAVGEELLRRVSTEVRERQHRDRSRAGRLRPVPPSQRVTTLRQIEQEVGVTAGAGIVLEQFLPEAADLDAHGRIHPRVERRLAAEGLGRDGVLLRHGVREGALDEVSEHRRRLR